MHQMAADGWSRETRLRMRRKLAARRDRRSASACLPEHPLPGLPERVVEWPLRVLACCKNRYGVPATPCAAPDTLPATRMPKRRKPDPDAPPPIQLPLFAEAASLVRVSPERNEHRFYRLEVWPDLFGRALLVRHWGRLGTPGRRCLDPIPIRALRFTPLHASSVPSAAAANQGANGRERHQNSKHLEGTARPAGRVTVSGTAELVLRPS